MTREWLYGKNSVLEALRARRRRAFRCSVAEGVKIQGILAEIVTLCEAQEIPLEWSGRDTFRRFGQGHQGIALQTEGYQYVELEALLDPDLEGPQVILLLDTLQDPHNLGALLRSAEAFGIRGVCLPLRRTVTVTPAVVNASAGASEHMRVAQFNLAQAIDSLKREGYWVLGLDSGQDAVAPEVDHFSGPVALVVGSEGTGMRPLIRKSCDLILRLPMRGNIASLNAAAAGSIALYLATHNR
jgi:23S rRNA (guanosine2251-2'-O)-methyltransferase